jgi:hypothetical protein
MDLTFAKENKATHKDLLDYLAFSAIACLFLPLHSFDESPLFIERV